MFLKNLMSIIYDYTITDNSLWASLHKHGLFLLEISDVRNERLFFLCFFFKATIQCDDYSLRYSSPSDEVYLHHISGQSNGIFSSLEKF
jgi:hypothetical protein